MFKICFVLFPLMHTLFETALKFHKVHSVSQPNSHIYIPRANIKIAPTHAATCVQELYRCATRRTSTIVSSCAAIRRTCLRSRALKLRHVADRNRERDASSIKGFRRTYLESPRGWQDCKTAGLASSSRGRMVRTLALLTVTSMVR